MGKEEVNLIHMSNKQSSRMPCGRTLQNLEHSRMEEYLTRIQQMKNNKSSLLQQHHLQRIQNSSYKININQKQWISCRLNKKLVMKFRKKRKNKKSNRCKMSTQFLYKTLQYQNWQILPRQKRSIPTTLSFKTFQKRHKH